MFVNVSLILPCFNEEKNIQFIVEEFFKINFLDTSCELILVNNGSNDNTEAEIDKNILKFQNEKLFIKKINLKKNLGYGGGIAKGLQEAKGEYIGWCHADFQTPLEDFFKLYNLIKNKKNVLGKGFRTNNRGFDGIVSTLHEKLATIILGKHLTEINAQPKIFHKETLKNLKNLPYEWTSIDTYIVYFCKLKKYEIIEMDVVFRNRLYGESKWKNNTISFLKHIIFNVTYLFKLRLNIAKIHFD
jgi:glycosyltransferase involved in cell wall biosynthesis